MSEVVVTGIGPILANCDSREAMWQHLSRGESQLSAEPSRDVRGETFAAGRVQSFEAAKYLGEIPEHFHSRYHREIQFYLASLFLARDDAKVDLKSIELDRVGLFDGSSRNNFEFWYDRIRKEAHTPASELYTRRELMTGMPGGTVGLAASLLKIRGPTYVFNGTCSSGAIAIGHAYREVASGEIDVAFATGHDLPLVQPLLTMYRDAKLVSVERDDPRRAVRPFVDHSTNAFGEGAVTLVLESRAHAEARGATILARIDGYRHGNNGYHPTTVDVVGVRPAEIIQRLLDRAHVAPRDVGFVVGHGNAVHLSDVSEENYMRLAFGAHAGKIPLVSTKPIYGHTMGASSAVNAAAAVLMLHHGYVIPTINVDPERVKRAAHHQANVGAELTSEVGLSMSYGMGGHNAALLFSQYRSQRAEVAA